MIIYYDYIGLFMIIYDYNYEYILWLFYDYILWLYMIIWFYKMIIFHDYTLCLYTMILMIGPG